MRALHVEMTAEGTLHTIRRILFWALIAGMIGTGAELLLIGHVENVWQLLPVLLLGLGVAVALWHRAAPSGTSLNVLRGLMLLFIIAGPLGTTMHYQGNTEFELEMYPSLSGFDLVKETMTGATPVLAPGTMSLLGLIGLAQSYGARDGKWEMRNET